MVDAPLSPTRGLTPKTAVTAVTPVTGPKSYGSNPLELRELRALRVKKHGLANHAKTPVTEAVTAPPLDADASILEREGMAVDGAPGVYLTAWARLQTHRPFGVSSEAWQRAVVSAGLFLDRWGEDAARLGWTAGQLFDAPYGLVWRLDGGLVEALGIDHARTADGRQARR